MDWIGNNLYWTNDGYRKTISVARLERAADTRKTLLEGEMSHPRAIVVDPLNRYRIKHVCSHSEVELTWQKKSTDLRFSAGSLVHDYSSFHYILFSVIVLMCILNSS